ncbi:BTAD domain-containing putative transcriptional regulator [Pseudonocardia sp.]|uniref:ATP-binding protein n=1 Tax=Pseudonocardia sp. TaxID=60912 RepID=UPI00261684BE|nr:BTAD domain-containing putative transcriptional regulator [Pseudonocardia sp.]
MAPELTLLPRVAHRGREITGPRLRGLLALLAADLRAGAGTARLVDGLWPDGRPENPTKALQILVSRARAQLGAGVIATTATGYRLAVDEGQVDAAALLRHVAAATELQRTADHAGALDTAEAGLALWDGTGDIEAGDPVAELRRHRMAAVRTLRRVRALALAHLGRRDATALAELHREHPRDEEVLLELLRAEAATAGPSAALARYDTFRRTLRDELGTDPGPALRAWAQDQLRSQGPEVRRGVAYEPNELLGRDADAAAVGELLRRARVTSIVGPGGLGKTRLAHVVARQAEHRVVHLVALAGLGSAGEVVGEVASALGLGESRHRAAVDPDVVTGILGALGTGPTLLVLDNCEHVLDGVADLVRVLVAMTRDLTVLTTSRAPLGLTSESVYPLPELTLPVTVELFGRRARAARAGVELPAPVVEDLCRHLDGLPLAVELAAARTRVMSVAEIARRLDDRFALLRGGARDAPERHRTLHAVVDWSWNLLDPAGRAAWRALSLFPGGFTAGAAAHLVGGPARGDVLGVLEHLVDQSLLAVDDTGSEVRFRMLETVREFGAARRDEAGETEAAIDGLLAWARDLGVAHHAAPFGPDPATALARVSAEQDNLAFALRHGLERCDGATVAAVTAVLAGLYTFGSESLRMVALVRDTSGVLSRFRPGPAHVEVARTAATLAVATQFSLFGARATRALVLLRRLPPAPADTPVRAMATVLAAAPEVLGPDPEPLRRMCGSAEPLLAGIARGVAIYVHAHANDPAGARGAAESMVASFHVTEHPYLWVLARALLVEKLLLTGDAAAALPRMREMQRLLDGFGDSADAFQIRWAAALAHLQAGDPDEAERLLDGAEPSRAAGFTFDVELRAEIALARGALDTGLGLWRRAVTRLRDTEGLDVDPTGLEPWALEIHATAVVAHARHGRLDLVADIATDLPHTLAAMLDTPVDRPPGYFVVYPLWGAFLLAQAMLELAEGRDGATAARMIALAQALHYPQQAPTMAARHAVDLARRAGGPAYDEAVSSYAGLDPEGLRRAAQELLGQRDGSRS